MKWFWLLLTVIFVALGAITLLPAPAAKPCLLGYRACCSLTPISTITCWAIATVCHWLTRKVAHAQQPEYLHEYLFDDDP